MWIHFSRESFGPKLDTVIRILRRIEIITMTTNDELRAIGAKLDEAQAELKDLPGQIRELLSQVGDQADPELVASLKAKAELLANIVPDPTPEEPPVVDPDAPDEDVPADPEV